MKIQNMIMALVLAISGALSLQAKVDAANAALNGLMIAAQGPQIYADFKVFVPNFKAEIKAFQAAEKTKKLVPFFAMLEMVMDRLESGALVADNIMTQVILNLIPDGASFDKAKVVADSFHASKIIIDALQSATKEMKMNLTAPPTGKGGKPVAEVVAEKKVEEKKLEEEQLQELTELEGLFPA